MLLAFQTPSRTSYQEERRRALGGNSLLHQRRPLQSPPVLRRRTQFRYSSDCVHDQDMEDLLTELSPGTFASLCCVSGEGTNEGLEGNPSETSPVLPLLPLMIELQDDDEQEEAEEESPAIIPEFPSITNETSLLPSNIRLRPRKKIRGCPLPPASR